MAAHRLILDSGVLIAIERGRLDLASISPDDADVVVPAIVVAEFMVGVELAATDRQRHARQAFLDHVLRALPIEPYGERVAVEHAKLLAHVHRTGQKRGAHDLIIAAISVATKRTVVTTDNRAKFDELPSVSAKLITVSP
ncbi:MAG: PIN domain-containing protein [Sciscionella sp.]|nr:PIN domain-containing protein [Sciscionella sp.]